MAIKYDEFEGTKKKELHIFYVLDTSSSMSGAPIGALNDAMRATVEELRKIDGDKADLRIGVLEYNSKNCWVTQGNNGLENLQDFFWTDLQATGMTYLGSALRELNTSLSRNDKMKSETGNKVPVVIFMSDGQPTDDWQEDLRVLAENKWYRAAIKIAFALGELADTDVLANVIGVTKTGELVPNYEAVIKTNDLQVFANMIQVVSVSSSLAASSSRPVGFEVTSEEIAKEAAGKNAKTDEKGVNIVDTTSGDDIYSQDPDDGFNDIV